MTNEKSHISEFFKSMRQRFEKCLDPTLACPNDAIKAHSVQNANALALIEQDNHVYELKMRVVNGKPVCEFQRIGRNNASIFPGLCNEHDTRIFRPIDTEPLDIYNNQHLFLLAYRSVTRELHAVMEGASRIQGSYQRLVSEGKVSGNQPSMAGYEATQHLLKAWSVWKYRYKYYDQDLVKGVFRNIKHSVFKIENEKPIVAASSFFSAEPKAWGRSFPGISLNVVPTNETETAVVFSYAKEHSSKARKYISPVILSKGENKKQELSLIILRDTENFFISPQKFESWSEHKRHKIEEFSWQTILQKHSPDDISEINIFE